jgi:hypothetical protein
VDRHRFYADLDPDPDWHQRDDADPHADPITILHISEISTKYFYLYSIQCQFTMFFLSDKWQSIFGIMFKFSGKKYRTYDTDPDRLTLDADSDQAK